MRKAIVDCDTGTDDAVALIGLLLAKDIEVIGITTVHGNLPVGCCADNSLQITEFLGKDIPVYIGCAGPLVKKLTPGRTLNTLTQTVRREYGGQEIRIHERDIGLLRTSRKPQDEHAVSYIVRTLKQTKEPIDIFALGPLTNIAAALIMSPEIIKGIGTIYIMGGALHCGNRTPVGEANFVDDPEAAETVLISGANILICPLEATAQGATYNEDDISRIEACGNETSRFIGALLRRFIWRCGMLWDQDFEYPPYEFPEDASCCVHDWAAVAPAIDMSVVSRKSEEICHVDFSGGMSDGQLVIDRRGYGGNANAQIVHDMDGSKCKALLLELIKSGR